MPSSTVPDPARDAAVRARALGTLSGLAAAVALLAVLPACGGGGGGDVPAAAPPAPVPSPAPTPAGPIAAQMTVPTPVGYDAERLAAFDRLNEIRLSAGLGMLAQSTRMDQAAQAHAEWMVANDSFTHDEQPGTPGFTGADWAKRDQSFGYVPVEGAEVLSTTSVGAAAGVDGLVNAVYHRAALLAFEPDDVGIGWTAGSAANVTMPLVIDLTRPGTDATRGMGQMAQASIHGVSVWPLDGAEGVPVRMGQEGPDPVPVQDVSTLGTPASIMIDESRTILAQSFVMRNHVTGVVVATQTLTYGNDPNFLVPHSFIALVPLAPLAPATRYDVAFSGSTTDFGSTTQVPLARTWSFTTGTP